MTSLNGNHRYVRRQGKRTFAVYRDAGETDLQTYWNYTNPVIAGAVPMFEEQMAIAGYTFEYIGGAA